MAFSDLYESASFLDESASSWYEPLAALNSFGESMAEKKIWSYFLVGFSGV
jgi:hypothetical protein